MDTFLGDTQLSVSVPFCYSSTCQHHFMDLVKGLLCGDNDQCFGGRHPPHSAIFGVSSLHYLIAVKKGASPGVASMLFLGPL